MNFYNVKMKNWVYCGDVNIAYGGVFYCKVDLENVGIEDHHLVPAVRVVGNESCENQYIIEQGQLYIPFSTLMSKDVVKREYSLPELPDDYTWRLLNTHNALWAHGIEDAQTTIVQIGVKPDPFSNDRGILSPDVVLRGNASIERYIMREFLGERA